MNLSTSIALALMPIAMHMCTACARTVAGFEVPYTFNPIHTGPGWNDSDVWVVTLISPKDGEAACLASHHDRDSNVTPVIVNGFSGGGEAMQIGVNIAFKRDEGQELSPTPAVLRFFQNGVALDTLQGNVSTSDNSEMWIAVISRAQLYDLLRKASDDRISVDLSANNGWSANISNLITSPDYLFGEIYPDQANIANRERNDFTECRRRARIISDARSPSANVTKLPPGEIQPSSDMLAKAKFLFPPLQNDPFQPKYHFRIKRHDVLACAYYGGNFGFCTTTPHSVVLKIDALAEGVCKQGGSLVPHYITGEAEVLEYNCVGGHMKRKPYSYAFDIDGYQSKEWKALPP